jgi:hypothetical protein
MTDLNQHVSVQHHHVAEVLAEVDAIFQTLAHTDPYVKKNKLSEAEYVVFDASAYELVFMPNRICVSTPSANMYFPTIMSAAKYILSCKLTQRADSELASRTDQPGRQAAGIEFVKYTNEAILYSKKVVTAKEDHERWLQMAAGDKALTTAVEDVNRLAQAMCQCNSFGPALVTSHQEVVFRMRRCVFSLGLSRTGAPLPRIDMALIGGDRIFLFKRFVEAAARYREWDEEWEAAEKKLMKTDAGKTVAEVKSELFSSLRSAAKAFPSPRPKKTAKDVEEAFSRTAPIVRHVDGVPEITLSFKNFMLAARMFSCTLFVGDPDNPTQRIEVASKKEVIDYIIEHDLLD